MDQYVRKPDQAMSMSMQTMALLVHRCVWQSRVIFDILSRKETVTVPCSSAARSTSSGTRDELIEHLFPWPFLLQRLMCLWFSKAMLLWWFSDVPDAPKSLVLSEHKSKSVKLKWTPGDDHNSSTTGKKGNLRLQVLTCTYIYYTLSQCFLP